MKDYANWLEKFSTDEQFPTVMVHRYIREACAEAYADGQRSADRRAAKLAMKNVPCSICAMSKKKNQFCESFGCSSFRELAARILHRATSKEKKARKR